MIKTKPRFLSTGLVPVTLLRRGKGTRVNGRYVPDVEQSIDILANVQPLFRGIRTHLNPYGDITTLTFLVLTNEPVRQQKEGDDGWEADVILWNNERLIVMQASNYSMGVLDHHEAVCVREEVS